MGDVVMTLPAIKWLTEQFTNCQIWYLTDPSFARIVQLSKHVHQVETIDRRAYKSRRRLIPALWDTVFTMIRLRRRKFRVVFDLQGFGETALIARLTGAPMRVGRIKGSWLRKRLYTHPIRADWEHDHRSHFFLKAVAQGFGCPASAFPDRPLLEIDRHPDHGTAHRVGFNIGASTESRRWSEKNFFLLAKRLRQNGLHIRFFLGPQERHLESAIKAKCDAEGWEYCVPGDMDMLIRTLTGCRLLVSNDTGPGHVAAALGIPVVTLFSTGSPENVRPLAEHGRWLRNRVDINNISVAEVQTACMELIRLLED
jgi:heptosyltransferase-1